MVEVDCQQIDHDRTRDKSLDAMTFMAYPQSRNASPRTIANAAIWNRAMLGQEPQDISALYFLNYCKSGGGLLQIRADRKGGGQYLRVRQGTQTFAQTIANALPSERQTVGARKVISALPATVLKTIDFQPPLPARKELLVNSFRYEYYTKVMVMFTHPWWVEKGYCGLVQSFTGNKWILTCFLAGDPGKQWSQLQPQARLDAILKQLGDLYTDPAKIREAYVDSVGHEWTTERYSGYGCPCSSLAPGVLGDMGDALQEPFRDVHFVGTEHATKRKGYIGGGGAVRSGNRGAAEVMKDLASIVFRW